ncbi:hypothetical protein C6497_10545 [Candidatus Poribacteria bacterium]|nr:MAG: hypothetical protein C6497_10545 [Candidatus Poribacteria bacterium]
MNKCINCGKERGFTFAEILVTIAIMAAVLPALLKVFSDISRSQVLMDNRLTALNLLKFQMAEIEANGFPDVGQESGEFGEDSQYQWESIITEVDPEELEGLLRVEVTISWSHLGQVKSIGAITYMANRELQ